MKHILFGMISLVIVGASISLEAQERWNVEFRGGVAFPTQDLGDTKLDTGFGIEGMLSYRFMPHLAAYAGWGWNQFSAEQSFAGTDADFEETGYTFGLQFIHPFGRSALNYLIRAGGIFNHIETENKAGDIVGDSEHGLGWQIDAGLAIPFGERWQVLPGIRYRSLSRDIEVDEAQTAVDLSYLSAGVGVSFAF